MTKCCCVVFPDVPNKLFISQLNEKEKMTPLQNSRNYSPEDTASHHEKHRYENIKYRENKSRNRMCFLNCNVFIPK